MFLSRTILSRNKTLLISTGAALTLTSYFLTRPTLTSSIFTIGSNSSRQMSSESFPKGKSEAEWQAQLTSEQFRVSGIMLCLIVLLSIQNPLCRSIINYFFLLSNRYSERKVLKQLEVVNMIVIILRLVFTIVLHVIHLFILLILNSNQVSLFSEFVNLTKRWILTVFLRSFTWRMWMVCCYLCSKWFRFIN